ncbi:hypothetical protein CYLTODRAFT_481571 [Cylindrobasidium torrendii FP15055 ss-10]|uniref:C2H2-type domain-containing protein n=1 Tax=Cylindrobasidium torrendii FP15055 ss-10 TaxID=1314674 RepID=A0A0D7BDF9_9AGAR|nr:hypothetical protein CYLTODRAFT_481571 [Cylindrobasidium torrendii FP15055 ss-10]
MYVRFVFRTFPATSSAMPAEVRYLHRNCQLCSWSSPLVTSASGHKLLRQHINDKHSGHRFRCNFPMCTTTLAFSNKSKMKKHANKVHCGIYAGETLQIDGVDVDTGSIPSTLSGRGMKKHAKNVHCGSYAGEKLQINGVDVDTGSIPSTLSGRGTPASFTPDNGSEPQAHYYQPSAFVRMHEAQLSDYPNSITNGTTFSPMSSAFDGQIPFYLGQFDTTSGLWLPSHGHSL